MTGLVLIVPIVLTVHQIVQGSDAFVHWITQLRQEGIAVPSWVAQLPVAGEYLDRWWQANLSNPRAVVEWLRGVNMESVTTWSSALGGELLHRLFLFLITLIALFFVFRDGAWLADRALETADRLLGDPGELLASKIADAIRGTVNGTVAVAVVVVEGVINASLHGEGEYVSVDKSRRSRCASKLKCFLKFKLGGGAASLSLGLFEFDTVA